MQRIHRRTGGKGRHAKVRWLILLALALLLLAGWLVLEKRTKPPETGNVGTIMELYAAEPEAIRTVSVVRPDGTAWTILRQEDGSFRPDGENWQVSASWQRSILRAVQVIQYHEQLTADESVPAEHLADFGFDRPLQIAVSYADGTEWRYRIGAPVEEGLRYAQFDGLAGLYAVDSGTYDSLNIELQVMHPVAELGIQKARIDRIEVLDGSGKLLSGWELRGNVADAAAADCWFITAPYPYPADGDAVSGLRDTAAGLRLGTYTAEREDETLAAYGLDEPRRRLRIHQQEALVNETDGSGAVAQVRKAAAETELLIGSSKNDYVCYVLYGDAVYAMLRYPLESICTMDPSETASRYVAPVALDSLASLEIEQAGRTVRYTLERETDGTSGERVLVCRRNGEPFDADAFSSAYLRLENVMVSGALPAGWEPVEAPHTVYRFLTREGQEYTVALSAFDPMHDAVSVNGQALFYLISGGMRFETETPDK